METSEEKEMNNTFNNNAQKKNTIQNSTILITGGTGFIGSHLVDALATPIQQNKVIILDNLSTGKIANITHHFEDNDINLNKATAIANKNKEEQKQVKSVSNKDNTVTFIKGDIKDRVLLQNMFQKFF
jgi:UDP-glucose 4-epimerase